MKRVLCLTLLALAVALPAFSEPPTRPGANSSFASDMQTIPVMGNNPGQGGSVFQTYVAILNPTASSFPVTVSLWDSNGTKRDAMITLAAGELKTYQNFLQEVFGFTGGGAVTFKAAETLGNNNRFIVSTEVRTSGTRYSTTIPALEFAGSSSRSFAAGITVGSETRTNVGCFNQSGVSNTVRATVFDASGHQNLGSTTLTLAPNGWGQTAILPVVSGGYVQFDPQEAAVCYAVVVDNSTHDGRYISAVEYKP